MSFIQPVKFCPKPNPAESKINWLLLKDTLLNPYQSYPAKIIEIKEEAENVKLFRLEPIDKKILNFQPGQFVLVSWPGFGEAPFVPCSRSLFFERATLTEGQGSESRNLSSRLGSRLGRLRRPRSNSNHCLELCVRQAGTVTTKLHSLVVGDEIYLRGPYGQGFPISNLKSQNPALNKVEGPALNKVEGPGLNKVEGPALNKVEGPGLNKVEGSNLLLIAGGIGLIALRPVILQAAQLAKQGRKIQVFIGAKTINDLLFKDEYEVWKKQIDCQITLDEKCPAWTGSVGVITELFKKVKVVENALAWLCGPPNMYKFVIEKLKENNFKDEDIYLSLERRMHCGLGICQHCAIGSKYVCQDGPVFRYSQIKDMSGAI